MLGVGRVQEEAPGNSQASVLWPLNVQHRQLEILCDHPVLFVSTEGIVKGSVLFGGKAFG